MKDEEKTPITQSYRIEPVVQRTGDYTYKYVEKYMYEITNSWENFCIDSLYKEYKKMGITNLFVINREEFKRFLLWALPLYYEKEKKVNDK